MNPRTEYKIAIIDYGICNMFSVKHACEKAGFLTSITSSISEIMNADAAILPGVGAFGDAMSTLKKMDLISPIRDLVASGKPLIGICLGYQLLMTESSEFVASKGLDIIPGFVKKFENPTEGDNILKVPHVGWNQIYEPADKEWEDSLLARVENRACMYFCHSFYGEPIDKENVLAVTRYGNYEFTTAICRKNVVAFQFHPEKSGQRGEIIYSNIKHFVGKCEKLNRR